MLNSESLPFCGRKEDENTEFSHIEGIGENYFSALFFRMEQIHFRTFELSGRKSKINELFKDYFSQTRDIVLKDELKFSSLAETSSRVFITFRSLFGHKAC